MGLDNVPNVGWVSFFLRVEEKNKINSFKFALSYQKAKSCLFLIKRYRIYLVVCRSYTCYQRDIYLKGDDAANEIKKLKAGKFIFDIYHYFPEEYFETKKIVYLYNL